MYYIITGTIISTIKENLILPIYNLFMKEVTFVLSLFLYAIFGTGLIRSRFSVD